MFRVKNQKDMGTSKLEPEVRDRLRELAEASKHCEPSVDVEARLLRAFADASHARSAPSPWCFRWTLAAAAAVVVAATLLILRTTGPGSSSPVAAGEQRETAAAPDEPLDGFVLVPGVASLPRLESASIVRYELPVTALPAYGLDIVPDGARRAVQADLLIGQDGHARAIRLISTNTRSTP